MESSTVILSPPPQVHIHRKPKTARLPHYGPAVLCLLSTTLLTVVVIYYLMSSQHNDSSRHSDDGVDQENGLLFSLSGNRGDDSNRKQPAVSTSTVSRSGINGDEQQYIDNREGSIAATDVPDVGHENPENNERRIKRDNLPSAEATLNDSQTNIEDFPDVTKTKLFSLDDVRLLLEDGPTNFTEARNISDSLNPTTTTTTVAADQPSEKKWNILEKIRKFLGIDAKNDQTPSEVNANSTETEISMNVTEPYTDMLTTEAASSFKQSTAKTVEVVSPVQMSPPVWKETTCWSSMESFWGTSGHQLQCHLAKLEKLRDSLFDMLALNQLQQRCSPGEWCIGNDGTVDQRFSIFRSQMLADWCNISVQCIEPVQPVVQECDETRFTFDTIDFMCKLFDEREKSPNCLIGLLKIFHVTLIQLTDRYGRSQEEDFQFNHPHWIMEFPALANSFLSFAQKAENFFNFRERLVGRSLKSICQVTCPFRVSMEKLRQTIDCVCPACGNDTSIFKEFPYWSRTFNGDSDDDGHCQQLNSSVCERFESIHNVSILVLIRQSQLTATFVLLGLMTFTGASIVAMAYCPCTKHLSSGRGKLNGTTPSDENGIASSLYHRRSRVEYSIINTDFDEQESNDDDDDDFDAPILRRSA